jgi:hypothetical protein
MLASADVTLVTPFFVILFPDVSVVACLDRIRLFLCDLHRGPDRGISLVALPDVPVVTFSLSREHLLR